MRRAWGKALVIVAAGLLGVTGCSNDPEAPAAIDPGVTVDGLNFQLAGATLSSVGSALPAADASFAAPLVRIDRSPTVQTPATITVSATEPFQSVLVQPSGSSSYVRLFLPAQTQLIAITVQARTAGSSSVATSVSIAIGNGARTSRASVLSLLALGS